MCVGGGGGGRVIVSVGQYDPRKIPEQLQLSRFPGNGEGQLDWSSAINLPLVDDKPCGPPRDTQHGMFGDETHSTSQVVPEPSHPPPPPPGTVSVP